MRTSHGNHEHSRLLALRLGVLAIVLLLLTLPLAHVTALRSASFVLAVLCGGFIFLKYPRGQARTPPLTWVFLLWLIAALLSLNSSPHVAIALEQIWGEVIKGALIFYSAYFVARERQNSVVWFFAAATSISLLASVSIATWLPQGKWQAVGLTPALGDYCTSAITLFPLVLLPAFSPWRQRVNGAARPFALLSAALAVSAGILALSRAFWLSAAVMLLCVALVWRLRLQRQPPISKIVISLAMFALFAFLVARWREFDLFYFANRGAIYGPVLAHVLEAPLFGFGYGHESLKQWYVLHMTEPGVMHAHNLVLSYAEQMGLLGILAVFGIFGGLGQRFFRHISDTDLYRASFATLGLALLAGIFVKNSVDIFFVRHNLLLFFLCCGVLLGTAECGERRQQ